MLTKTERNKMVLALHYALDLKIHKLYWVEDAELLRLYEKYC